MIEHVLHPRIRKQRWATVLFVLSFAIIAITNHYMKIVLVIYELFSQKYSKVYRDSSQLKSSFTISLFIVLNYFSRFFFTVIARVVLVMQQKQIGFFFIKFLLFISLYCYLNC
jgi:hypothetical protein